MKTSAAFALVGAAVARGASFWRGVPASQLRRVLGDVILVAIFLGLAAWFLRQNGCIGNSDIQPYPY
jgi:hypothetical protein